MHKHQFTDNLQILESKKFTKGREFKTEYPSPLLIFSSFFSEVEKRTDGKTVLSGENPVTNLNEDGTENTSWGRIMLKYQIDIDQEMHYQVAVLAAFDIGKPIIKVVSGIEVRACTNLCIFSGDDIAKFELAYNPEGALIAFKNYIERLNQKIQNAKEIILHLVNTKIKPTELPEIIGKAFLLTETNGYISGKNCLNKAVEMLCNKKSKYYQLQANFNAWHLYNSCTEYFAEKCSFLDIPEKALAMWEILKPGLMPVPKAAQGRLNIDNFLESEVNTVMVEEVENLQIEEQAETVESGESSQPSPAKTPKKAVKRR